jgi:hypothetical protein
MTDNLLAEDNSETITIDPNKNYVEELVGEGKKFKTIEDLARGKYESDLHIKIMEKRSDELRNDYLKVRDENLAKAKLEELIDKMQAQQLSPSSYQPPANDDKTPPTIDSKQIESLIDSQISRRETESKEKANFNTVQNRLKERFGNSYQAVLKEQIDTLGLTIDDVNVLAKKSPNAFFRTMGLDQPQQTESFQAPVRSNQMSSFKPTTQKRTWSYYQELKKQNPKLYYDPKIANQMHKDYEDLGPQFEDGDFKAL